MGVEALVERSRDVCNHDDNEGHFMTNTQNVFKKSSECELGKKESQKSGKL